MALEYKTYDSFSELLHDIPTDTIFIPMAIAAIPFIIFILWKTPILRTLFIAPMARFYTIWSSVRKYTKKREKDTRVKEEYEEMVGGKKAGALDIFTYGTYLSMLIFGGLILKKAFYLSLVISQSMMPIMAVSDIVVVESLSTGDVEVGDILVFRPSGYGYSITHRVVSVDNGRIRTKGDNSVAVDRWALTDKNIEGKLLTVKGKPVVIKNIGMYFMPTGAYALGQDPTYDLIKSIIQTVHTYGPVILVILLLFILASAFEGRRRYKTLYERQ